MFRIIMIAAGLCLAAARLSAQGDPNEIKKKLAEISGLMRDSERLLLELSQTERLIAKQEEIVARLKELEPPESAQPANPEQASEQSKEQSREREKLREQQAETARKLGELLDGQKQSGETAVRRIEELLASLPRSGGGGQGQEPRPQNERRPKEKQQEDQKQLSPEERQREEEMRRKEERKKQDEQRTGQRPPPKGESSEAMKRRVEAWIARLPPEEQDRLRHGDLSGVPARYRRLVEEYTKAIARRDTEEQPK